MRAVWHVLASTALAAAVVAAEEPTEVGDVACPASLAVEQKPASVPAGWTVTAGEPSLGLAGVLVYDGPPSDEASLVPDQKKTRRELTSTWRFPTSRPRDFWLACVYGSSAIRLTRVIPANISRCVAVHTLDPKTGRADELLRVTCSR
jgi:hypothetical protein